MSADGAYQQGCAVGRLLGDVQGADRAARAGAVLRPPDGLLRNTHRFPEPGSFALGSVSIAPGLYGVYLRWSPPPKGCPPRPTCRTRDCPEIGGLRRLRPLQA